LTTLASTPIQVSNALLPGSTINSAAVYPGQQLPIMHPLAVAALHPRQAAD
jgi:hypothetical protein